MQDINSIKIEDQYYPEKLKEIKDAPKILYYQGTLPSLNEKCIAIVGTRNASTYGQQVAIKISEQLTDTGLTIISGLAPGIDTFCHKTVVSKKKRTVAILGTGLDEKSIYPRSNLDLTKKIIENGGCLISELPEGTPGSKFSFPRRNRIISALSCGVLVIEAKEKSGSLITAEYAKKQNKKLFSIPGPIYSQNSEGTNKLIKNGAILVSNVNDILKELNINHTETKKYIVGDDKNEKVILKILSREPMHIDKIIKDTGITAQGVTATLALMEISGKIRSLGGNIYSIN